MSHNFITQLLLVSSLSLTSFSATPATALDTPAKPPSNDSDSATSSQLDTYYRRLTQLEQKTFDKTFSDLIPVRLSRLEKQVFGSAQTGTNRLRLDRLLIELTTEVNFPNKTGSNNSKTLPPPPAPSRAGRGGNFLTSLAKPVLDISTDLSQVPKVENSVDSDFGPYMAELQRRMKQAWNPPKGTENEHVVVQFQVTRAGVMSDLQVKTPSSMPAANDAACSAVEHSFPFQALPAGAPESVYIQFSFDYNVYKSGWKKF